MSIVSVNELSMMRHGQQSSTGISLKRVFLVETNDSSDGPTIIYASSSIPNPLDRHPNNSDALCDTIMCQPYEDRVHWHVICNYKTAGPTTTGILDIAPDLPAKISFSFVPHNVVAGLSYWSGLAGGGLVVPDPLPTEADVAVLDRGDPWIPINNSAGDIFDPTFSDTKYNMLIKIVRGEKDEDFDPNNLEIYRNSVNYDPVVIADIEIEPYKGWMREISADKRWDENNDVWWEVTYQIEIDDENHLLKALDRGFYQFTGVGQTTKEHIVISDGTKTKTPLKLDGSGRWIGAVVNPAAYSVYLGFLTKWPAKWESLELPSKKTGDE